MRSSRQFLRPSFTQSALELLALCDRAEELLEFLGAERPFTTTVPIRVALDEALNEALRSLVVDADT